MDLNHIFLTAAEDNSTVCENELESCTVSDGKELVEAQEDNYIDYVFKLYPAYPAMSIVAGLINFNQWKDYTGVSSFAWTFTYCFEIATGVWSLTIWALRAKIAEFALENLWANILLMDSFVLVATSLLSILFVNYSQNKVKTTSASTTLSFLLHLATFLLSIYFSLYATSDDYSTPEDYLGEEGIKETNAAEEDEDLGRFGTDEDGYYDIWSPPECDPSMEICPEL